MSATEFARPHPKPRYSNGPVNRNGSSSNSVINSKFSEQNSPVNLAVTNSTIPTQQQPKDDRLLIEHQSQKVDVSSNLYPPPRMPQYCGHPTVVSNAYREIEYPGIYSRSANMYGTTGLYSSHVLASRPQSHHRNAFMASQLDSYSSYLPYNPPSTLGVLVPPQIQIDANSVISSSIPSAQNGGNGIITTKSNLLINENNSSSHNHNRHHSSLPPSITMGRGGSLSGIGNSGSIEKIEKERSLSTSNNKNVGFKVPSGKEGSLKHRILIRPNGEKDGRRKSPSSVDKVTLPTTNNNNPTNFSKGQLVEIAHGELKRIEDLRTEDFMIASGKTQNLQMIDTTVVKITPNSKNVTVTLSYGNHRKKMTEIKLPLNLVERS
jgi:hypothetical protein